MVMFFPDRGGVPTNYKRDRNAIEKLPPLRNSIADLAANSAYLGGIKLAENADGQRANLGTEGSLAEDKKGPVSGFVAPGVGSSESAGRTTGSSRTREDLEAPDIMPARYEDLGSKGDETLRVNELK